MTSPMAAQSMKRGLSRREEELENGNPNEHAPEDTPGKCRAKRDVGMDKEILSSVSNWNK